MTQDRLPIIGTVNARRRSYGTTMFDKDQWFRGAVLTKVVNPSSQSQAFYLEKRSGMGSASTVAAGASNAGIFLSPRRFVVISAFHTGTQVTIYHETTSVGDISDSYRVQHISEAFVSNITYWLFTTSSTTVATQAEGWYLASDSFNQTSYTGTLSSGTPTVTSIASTAGMYAGQKITGTGIPSSPVTRIQSVDSSSQITMTANATANGAQTITKTPLAKFIDADFPSGGLVGEFCEMDGYIFIAARVGKIFNSDLNSISAWSASSFASSDQQTDRCSGAVKYRNQILSFGSKSIEFWYNAGNAAGSPLSRTSNEVSNIGGSTAGLPWSNALIAASHGLLAWIWGQNSMGASVFVMEGFSPKRISTSAVESLLATGVSFIDIYKDVGNTFINICGLGGTSTNAFNIQYCMETGLWGDFGHTKRLRFTSSSFPGSALAAPNAKTVCSDMDVTDSGTVTASGKIFTLSPTTYTDDSVAFTLRAQTSKWDGGTGNWKFIHSVTLGGSDVQSSGTATLEYSDDDYVTWTTAGTFDLTNPTPRIWGLGGHRGGRAYRLTHSANTAFRAQFLDINYTASPV